jgi:hypothetical protein
MSTNVTPSQADEYLVKHCHGSGSLLKYQGLHSCQSGNLYSLAAAQIYDHLCFIQGMLLQKTVNNLIDCPHSQPLKIDLSINEYSE